MNNGNVTIILANTVDEALRMWVPNGCTTFFVVFNEATMVLRSTDIHGFPAQPRFFDLTERFQYNQPQQIPQNQQTNQVVNQPLSNGSEFATKAEFDELKALIIQSMNNPQPAPVNNQSQQRNDKRKGGNNS